MNHLSISNDDIITGTLIHYFFTCKRESWLYGHKIYPDEENENVALGRAEHQNRDFGVFSYIKFDKIDKINGYYRILEYKKTLKNKNGPKWQLIFYMYLLQKNYSLKKIDGFLISKSTKIHVIPSEEDYQTLEKAIISIKELLKNPTAPQVIEKPICKKCAYFDYCFI
jgi:CRISPR-associated exonuclease Cas4